jgi:hypothetical protein
MCNCGKKRSQLKPQSNTSNNNYTQNVQQPVYQQQIQPPPAQIKQMVMFQYTGSTALTITGNTTRRNYRFSFPGDIQSVAFSDAAAMAGVPVLKRV